MWLRVNNILLVLCLLPGLLWAAPKLFKQDQHWRGVVELAGPLQVPPGRLLTIAAGTEIKALTRDAKLTIRGRLHVNGSEADPVVFNTPTGWKGIEFIEADAGSLIDYATFTSCSIGVSVIATSPEIKHSRFLHCEVAVQLLRESESLIEENSFSENQVGLKVGMKSNPQILKNHFILQSKAGIDVTNGSKGLIEENRFIDNSYGLVLQKKFLGKVHNNFFQKNKVALFSFQTQNTPLIEANLFSDNGEALQAFSFSYPAVRNNRFIDNGTALHNDQFGSPLVENNLFGNNGKAILNNRKSSPEVRNNKFENNELALFCDYSSYPQVKQNNFTGNAVAAELGIYQSADWEKRAGSKQIVMQRAQARGSKNPLLEQAPTQFSDQLDLSGNWWGEQTADLNAAGPDANLPIFFDRRDKSSVTYPGFGEESYLLDLIVYAPWLEKPVSDAGPEVQK